MKDNLTETYKISTTFNAPISFVFDWCTDFREDDSKMIGSKIKRQFLERTKRRIIWTVAYRENGKSREGIRAVWLRPPDSWHLDTCGDGRELGDYKLSSLGKEKTRLDMVFQVTYDDPSEIQGQAEWKSDALEHWKVYVRYLEKDYKESRRGKTDV